jgi:hypothetical protein
MNRQDAKNAKLKTQTYLFSGFLGALGVLAVKAFQYD